MKLAFLLGMALAGVYHGTPTLPTENVPVFNDVGDVWMDTIVVTHVLDAGDLHISRSHMLAADISCVSVVYLPMTTFQSCSDAEAE